MFTFNHLNVLKSFDEVNFRQKESRYEYIIYVFDLKYIPYLRYQSSITEKWFHSEDAHYNPKCLSAWQTPNIPDSGELITSSIKVLKVNFRYRSPLYLLLNISFLPNDLAEFVIFNIFIFLNYTWVNDSLVPCLIFQLILSGISFEVSSGGMCTLMCTLERYRLSFSNILISSE